jgi:hypothetical protein
LSGSKMEKKTPPRAAAAFLTGCLLLAPRSALFAGHEDSPLYRFRPENHAAAGHQGGITALAFATVPPLDIEEPAPAETDPVSPGDPAPVSEDADAETVSPAGQDYILSTGEDGFLCVWQQETAKAVERWQVSALPVSLMKAHPERPEIAYVETDGLVLHRLSVMNYWTKTPLFSVDFEDRITYITYTPGGSFIIVVTGGRGMIEIRDSRTGKEARPRIAAQAVFAAASPSERTLAVYSQTGRLSYWNLQTGLQTAEFPAAASLSEPVIFRNYNLIAGWLHNELVVINATNGRTLIRDPAVPYGTLFPVDGNSEAFAVSAPGGVTVYTVGDTGSLKAEAAYPAAGGGAALSAAGSFFLATEEGGIARVDGEGVATVFAAATQTRITDALISGETICYVTADGERGKMPVDYRAILNGAAVTLPAPRKNAPDGFPRSALNGKLLYLEPQGPVVYAADDGRELLSAFFPLTIDADFADDGNIVAAGMLAAGGSLLQLISIATGETVPIDLPDNITLKVYRGKSGDIYFVVSDTAGGKMRLLKLDTRNPRQSRRLVETTGEDDIFDMAEVGAALVTNMGSDSADFYGAARGNFLFSGERTGGMPARILDGGQSVIVVDQEGSLAWLDSGTGRLQAVMRLYADEWEITAADGQRASGR